MMNSARQVRTTFNRASRGPQGSETGRVRARGRLSVGSIEGGGLHARHCQRREGWVRDEYRLHDPLRVSVRPRLRCGSPNDAGTNQLPHSLSCSIKRSSSGENSVDWPPLRLHGHQLAERHPRARLRAQCRGGVVSASYAAIEVPPDRRRATRGFAGDQISGVRRAGPVA
jgi:hypothetical protein